MALTIFHKIANYLPHPDSLQYRLIILAFCCLLTFGSYYCFDEPSSLDLDGTTLTSVQYNLLYSVYSISNMVMVIGGGFLVDYFGNRICTFLFCSLICVGQFLFALGLTLDYYPLMLTGRIVFGTGGGSISVVQNAIASYWFKGKELALAFGVTLTASRLGSVLNFIITPYIAEWTSDSFALWWGLILCVISLIAALGFSLLDKSAEVITQRDFQSNKKPQLKYIKQFPITFWLLSLECALFYSVIFPFMAIAPSYFSDKFEYSKTKSSPIAGICYDVALIISPFLGRLVDIIGSRPIVVLIASTLLIFPTQIYSFTQITPYVPQLILGLSYSLAAAGIWSSVPLLLPLQAVGTALGIMTSIQMLIIAIFNYLVGVVYDVNNHWQDVNVMFSCLAIVTSLVGILLCIVDVKNGSILMKKSTGKSAAEEYDEEQSLKHNRIIN
eukprot:TRINITY_DN3341_c0_g1_i1.p1 TRINITY_DN3341_c0_g1~~TRINITY_DN3341_c0_g1_i1.p1  ORF type:complete len:442 (-),score=89.99 TRINITY_DN3341_c0_g1_i1:66-1391(-)